MKGKMKEMKGKMKKRVLVALLALAISVDALFLAGIPTQAAGKERLLKVEVANAVGQAKPLTDEDVQAIKEILESEWISNDGADIISENSVFSINWEESQLQPDDIIRTDVEAYWFTRDASGKLILDDNFDNGTFGWALNPGLGGSPWPFYLQDEEFKYYTPDYWDDWKERYNGRLPDLIQIKGWYNPTEFDEYGWTRASWVGEFYLVNKDEYVFNFKDESTVTPPTPSKDLTATGIYHVSQTRDGILAGLVTEGADKSQLEYSWYVCNDGVNWKMVQDWTKGNEWLSYKPDTYGDYVLVGKARPVGGSDAEIVQASSYFSYHPEIKGMCQMPYEGEGGGYLIGVESYTNPNQSYQYEMLILDCTLLAEGKDAWIYTTGKCGVSEGNALWTVWQPQYGYYWTLFRVFDAEGNLLDETCYGFVNAY